MTSSTMLHSYDVNSKEAREAKLAKISIWCEHWETIE